MNISHMMWHPYFTDIMIRSRLVAINATTSPLNWLKLNQATVPISDLQSDP